MKKSSIIFFLLGLVGLVVMILNTNFSQINSNTVIGLAPVWLPAIILIWAAIYFIHVLSYRVILGEEKKKVSFAFLIKMTLSGFALNAVTPVGLIGGEPYRILELKPHIGIEKSVSTTLTFSIMHVFGHVLFLFASAVAYLFLGCPGGTVATVIDIFFLVLFGLALFIFLRYGNKKLVMPTLKAFSRIPKVGKFFTKLIDKNLETIENIDKSMVEFHSRKRDFIVTGALEFFARLLEVFEFYFLFRMFGVHILYPQACVAVACAGLLGNILFLIPMQVGSREFGIMLVLSWICIDSSFAVTASLLARIREIIYLAVGVGAMLINSKKKE